MMIGCGYVQNFLLFFLPKRLSTRYTAFLTSSVNTYLLIMSRLSSFSTIPYFGAKLLSLYLFFFISRGKQG